MSPLTTIRRFEALAHDALRPPLDTVVMVAGAAIAVGTIMIGSPNDTAFDAAIIPLIVALAIAARVGRESAQRQCGEKAFDTSVITRLRLVYLGCALIAATATVFVFTAAAIARND